LITASVIVAVAVVVVAVFMDGFMDGFMDVVVAIQVEFSAHAVSAGHEKRASMQRTARGRGEHAWTNPAPVALLMHVCMGAHEMPFPQSLVVGTMVGIAWIVLIVLIELSSSTTRNAFMLCTLCAIMI
jgi:hypothetical protein